MCLLFLNCVDWGWFGNLTGGGQGVCANKIQHKQKRTCWIKKTLWRSPSLYRDSLFPPFSPLFSPTAQASPARSHVSPVVVREAPHFLQFSTTERPAHVLPSCVGGRRRQKWLFSLGSDSPFASSWASLWLWLYATLAFSNLVAK